jgi:hypothetical protein
VPSPSMHRSLLRNLVVALVFITVTDTLMCRFIRLGLGWTMTRIAPGCFGEMPTDRSESGHERPSANEARQYWPGWLDASSSTSCPLAYFLFGRIVHWGQR